MFFLWFSTPPGLFHADRRSCFTGGVIHGPTHSAAVGTLSLPGTAARTGVSRGIRDDCRQQGADHPLRETHRDKKMAAWDCPEGRSWAVVELKRASAVPRPLSHSARWERPRGGSPARGRQVHPAGAGLPPGSRRETCLPQGAYVPRFCCYEGCLNVQVPVINCSFPAVMARLALCWF